MVNEPGSARVCKCQSRSADSRSDTSQVDIEPFIPAHLYVAKLLVGGCLKGGGTELGEQEMAQRAKREEWNVGESSCK